MIMQQIGCTKDLFDVWLSVYKNDSRYTVTEFDNGNACVRSNNKDTYPQFLYQCIAYHENDNSETKDDIWGYDIVMYAIQKNPLYTTEDGVEPYHCIYSSYMTLGDIRRDVYN